MKTNRNEVEKGFLQRSFRQELVGIKENWQTQSSKGHISLCDSFPKMKQVKIPAHELDVAPFNKWRRIAPTPAHGVD